MPRTRVVIQSRLSSSRLPGKAMLTLGDRPTVVLVAQRAGQTGNEVVVATSAEPDDDVIATTLSRHHIRCFRGSLNDPLARFHAATADLDDDDVVVRLTADNCVPDGAFVDEMVASLRARQLEYIRVAAGLPYGLGAEAFTMSLLRAAHRDATTAFDREHVTPWMRRATRDEEFSPTDLPEDWQGIRCTVDTLDDFVIASRALERVGADPVAASWRDLLEAWRVSGGATDRLPVARPNALDQGPWVLGTVQLGMTYGAANVDGMPDPEMARRLLTLAATGGVTHLDTARAYGASEENLGRALAHGLAERLQVITKIRPLDAVPRDGDAALARECVRSSVNESLRSLRTDSVAALLLHRWADWGRGQGAVADELVAQRDSGAADVVGTSLSTPGELVAALDDERIGYVQLPFNILDRRWLGREVIDAIASRPDVIISARSVFLQGLLIGGDAARWPGVPGLDTAALRATLGELTQRLHRTSQADLCIAYVRGHEFVTSVVLGAETAAQVADHAELMRRPPLTHEEIAVVHEALEGAPLGLVDPSLWKMGP